MNFVYNSKVTAAFIAFMIVASCFTEKAAAIELLSSDGLLEALKGNRLLSDKDLNAIKNEYPKMEVNGSLQLQYIKADADIASDETDEMFIRRMNLTVVGRITDKLSMVIEPEYGKGEPTLRDAYLSYTSSGFGAFAGNHKVPFSAEMLNNDLNLRFVERTLTSHISPGRMMGVSVVKPMLNNKLTVHAGIWNSRLNSVAESELVNDRLADNQIFAGNSGSTGSNIFIQAVRVAYSSKGRDDFYTRENGYENDENFSREKKSGLESATIRPALQAMRLHRV